MRGPHPVPQFRFTFTAAQFENVVPWLMLNRQGLDVLVHRLTDNSYDDHSRYAVWLGSPVAEAQHDASHLPRRTVSIAALKTGRAEVFVGSVELSATHQSLSEAALQLLRAACRVLGIEATLHQSTERSKRPILHSPWEQETSAWQSRTDTSSLLNVAAPHCPFS